MFFFNPNLFNLNFIHLFIIFVQAEQLVATSLAHLVESASYTGSGNPITEFQQAINHKPLSLYAMFISYYMTCNFWFW